MLPKSFTHLTYMKRDGSYFRNSQSFRQKLLFQHLVVEITPKSDFIPVFVKFAKDKQFSKTNVSQFLFYDYRTNRKKLAAIRSYVLKWKEKVISSVGKNISNNLNCMCRYDLHFIDNFIY